MICDNMDEPEDTVLSGNRPVPEGKILSFHLYEEPKIVKRTETESRMVLQGLEDGGEEELL